MPNKKPVKLSEKTRARRFRDRNRRFLKLTRKQQRIKIIRDAITHLMSGKTIANIGEYLVISYRAARKLKGDDQVHDIVERVPCRVCGIGSAFVSAVTLKNKLTISDLGGETHYGWSFYDVRMRSYLRTWFTDTQLDLIEGAFERSVSLAKVASYSAVASAKRFGDGFETSKTRLLAIYKNMLENDGKFVPETSDKI